jgi:hypothetical protein
MQLLEQIDGWVQNGPYGNDKQMPDPVTMAVILGSKIVGGVIKRQQEKKLIAEQKKAGLKQLKAAGRMSPEEAQAMSRMKKGAEQGTMNVEKLNMQMAQPLYQQGEAQEAQAMGKITAQGLEGSIIAQEVSRKIGADVRASIATQARQIALENERTKADAERRYQESLMKRGTLMRELAMKRAGVISGAKLQQMQSKQGQALAAYEAGADFATGMSKDYSNQNTYTANEDTHPNDPEQWGRRYDRPD